MKNKTIFIGINQIEMAMDELRKKKEITKDSSIQIKKLLKRVGWLADPYNNLRDYAFIFFLLASLFVMYLLNVPFDKLTEISSWSGLALFLAGCVAFTASLIILSRLTLKAILHLPLKRAIAELGKAVKRNKPLRSIYTKHF
jgi:hypothetical protein